MEQQNYPVWNYIKDLLHVHDCVIVPGLGGFVCNRESARIDQITHIITPPARKVVFNQNLKTNDGLLLNYLANKESIGYIQASQFMTEFVNTFMVDLQDKKMVAIELFGSFRLNADANYVFLPDKRNNYLTSSFGLEQIQAKPISSRTIKTNKIKTFKEVQTPNKMKRERNVWPTALAIVLLFLLSVNGYIFLSDHSINDLRFGNTQSMGITSWFDSLFHKNEQPNLAEKTNTPPIIVDSMYLPPSPEPIDKSLVNAEEIKIEPTIAEKPEDNLASYAPYFAFASHYEKARNSIYFPRKPEIEPEIQTTIPPIENPPAPKEEKAANAEPKYNTAGLNKGFYIIGGVFCRTRNAMRFLKKLEQEGYSEAELLNNEVNNCKRVSYKRFNSRKEADSFCNEIKTASNPSAWLFSVQ